ncbi:unnamed protein product, partial [Lepeophtheirus salmonis]
RSTKPSFHEERYNNSQKPKEVNTTQDDVKVRYFENNVIEVELEVRDSKEEHREEDANWSKRIFHDHECESAYKFKELIFVIATKEYKQQKSGKRIISAL